MVLDECRCWLAGRTLMGSWKGGSRSVRVRGEQWQREVVEVPCVQSCWVPPKKKLPVVWCLLCSSGFVSRAEQLLHRVRSVGATMGDAAETGLLRQCRAAQGASVCEYLTRCVCGRRVLGEGGVYPKKYGVWTVRGMLFDKWGDARAPDMELLLRPMGSLDCTAWEMWPGLVNNNALLHTTRRAGARGVCDYMKREGGNKGCQTVTAIPDAATFLLFGRKHGTRHLGSAGRSHPTSRPT